MEYRQLFSIENNKILGYKDSKFKRIIEVTIPNSVTEISEFMFANCKNLKKVILPKTLKNINSYAFKNCENLITIIFPEKLIFIGDYAFWNCFNLKKVRIPESIREISSVAFYQCKLSDFSIETSLFYFEPNDFNLLFSNRHISKLTIYNHEFDYAKKYFNFETFMKYIRNIRREELKDKIDGVLLENGITDKSCFKYSEHKIFINEIVKKLEIVQHYKYDEDFNKYMEEYIARNKQELVQMNDIDIILDKIINTKINEFDMSDSTSMEKFAMELNPYPMLITSLFQIIVSFHTNDLEQIKMKKVLDNINNTNNLSNFITKMFLNTNEGDVTVNKSSIEKLKSYSNYKINRTNDENEYLEKLKKIIKVYIKQIDECLRMLDSVELNISIDELSKSDNDVINNNITIKRNSLNDSKIFMKNLYIEINNIISSNFICVEKLKEVLTLLIPIILCSSSLNIITLKTKEKIEMLNSASNILKKLILENENANFIIELSDNSIIKKLTN